MADVTRREAVQLAAATGLAALGASVAHADHGRNGALQPAGNLPIYLSVEKGVILKSGNTKLMGGKSYKPTDPGFPFKWVHDARAERYRLSLAPYSHATLVIPDTKKDFRTYIVASKDCHLSINLIPDDRQKNPDLCCVECHGDRVCDVPPFWLECEEEGMTVCCIG